MGLATSTGAGIGIFQGDWEHRLAHIVTTMREMSLHSDPQAMVRSYSKRMRELMPSDRFFSVSRRDLDAPAFRVTRSSTWEGEVNPWRDTGKLPRFEGGLVGELLYGDEPRIIDDVAFDPDDPMAAYLEGCRSLMAVPHYDQGEALNMVVLLREQPGAFRREEFPEWVWLVR